MATSPANAVIEEFDEIEEFPDDAPAVAIEEFDEPVNVQQEAARNTMGAVQAVDLMTLPGRIAAAQPRELSRDEQLFQESESLAAQMRLAEEQGQSSAGLSNQYFALRDQINPRELMRLEAAKDVPEPQTTPMGGEINPLGRIAREVIGGPLGYRLEELGGTPLGTNFQANIGAAAGGAVGAASMMTPVGPTVGAASISRMLAPVVPLAGGVMGGVAGGAAQESAQRATETPEQTAQRQQMMADVRAESPVQSMIGGSLANLPFMRPSLSQFTQALSGNRVAQQSIAAAAGIGGAMGALPNIVGGQPFSLAQIAQSALENVVFNKPTALGRAIGFPDVPTQPTRTDAQQIQQPETTDGGVQPPEVPPQDVQVSTPQGGAEVPPSGQEAPVAPKLIGTAIRLPDGTPIQGAEPTQSHTEIMMPAMERADPTAELGYTPKTEDLGFAVENPDGTKTFVDRETAMTMAKEQGLVPPDLKETKLTSEILREHNPTGIRNAIVDTARAERGLPEREIPGRRSFGTLWDEAKATMAQDPTAGRRLVDSLKENVRPLTDAEDAILTYEQTQRESQVDAALEAVNNAKTPEEFDAAQERLAAADNDAFDIYQVGQNAGTENARGLSARRMMVNRDLTLAQMRNETRARVNDGAPLSPEQDAKIQDLHKRISDLEGKLKSTDVKEARKTAQDEFRRVLQQTKGEAKEAVKARQSITDFMDAAAEKARQRIIERRGRLQVTVDPLNIAGLVDEAIIGASYVAKGVRDFAKWSSQMVSEFGERVRPHLDALFKRSSQLASESEGQFKTAANRTPEQVIADAQGSPALDQKFVSDLVRSHIRAGADSFETAMQATTNDLKKIEPSVTESQVMQAFSQYGKTSVPTKEADLKALREYRNLSRLTLQLEDAQKGLSPKKTGPQRDKASVRVRELQKKVNDAMRAAGVARYDPELQIATSLDASKTRIKNTIEELQRKIKANDYEPRVKRDPALDREKINLEFDLAKVKDEYQQGVIEAKRAKRSLGQKVIDTTLEGANLTRAIVTSADLAPVFRQGLFSIGRPITSAKAVVDSFKAMASERQRFKIDKEIRERPNAPLYQRAKLYLAKEGGQTLSQQEEAYMGNWFKSLPRWTLVGPLLRASERSYSTFLNRLRADTFDSMVRAYGVSDTDTATLRRVGDIINTMTGRSTLPGNLEKAATGLNTFLFAPRFMASRFKLAVGEPLWTGNAKTRTFALEQYGRTLAGAAVVYGLAKMAGFEVEKDPRSSNFGKIQLPNNATLDPLGGLAQVTTFLTRITTGETKTSKGKLVPLRETNRPLVGTGMEAKGKPNAIIGGGLDVAANFLRTKLNPVAGAVVNEIQGEDITGAPVTTMGQIKNLAVPISFQDILTTMEKQGVPRGTALQVLSLFGMGLQQREERKK